MASSPRLLLLCEYATLNGGEQSMLATLPTVLAAGFEVVVALPSAGPLVTELQSRQIRCVPFSLYGAASQRLPLSEARAKLAELIADVRPDLLHANSLAMGRLSGPVAQALNLPAVAHLRDIIGISTQAMSDLNCHRLLLAVSHATRDFHVAAGLDASKTKVLYNGVDLERFQPREPTGYVHRELNLPSKVRLIGWIGQLGLRKDPLTFLQAAQCVANEFSDVHFLLVGERNSGKQESLELETTLHDLVSKEPLTGRVHFLGVRSDVSILLNELSLLVHTSRQEPLGRVLLEAAASGTPVIATNVGGTAEIFPPSSSSACLIAPGDNFTLASALHKLLADASTRQRLGMSARQQVEMKFDVRQRAAELVDIYRSLLADCEA